jgi:hypothetical protein
MMVTQLGKKMGANVIAVSKDNWIKDFGADYQGRKGRIIYAGSVLVKGNTIIIAFEEDR